MRGTDRDQGGQLLVKGAPAVSALLYALRAPRAPRPRTVRDEPLNARTPAVHDPNLKEDGARKIWRARR
jgi:hypothetical protein